MKTKRFFRGISTLVVILLICGSWGSVGHVKISQNASLSFIQEMAQFNSWTSYLSQHAPDPDTASPKTKHYIDIDYYPVFVSTGRIPQTLDSMNSMYGASTVTGNGLLPWATKTVFDSITACMARGDWNKAKDFAAEMGHYVADAHQPLHLTENYDGQNSGNSGIHSRYESSMISQYTSQISYTGDSVVEIQDVNQYIFNYIYQNYPYMDSILLADNYAKTISTNTSSTEYKAALWDKTKTFTTLLFKNASHAFAELLYTAWKKAGSPGFATSLPATSGQNIHSFQAQPNPCHEEARLEFYARESGIANIQIYNLLGESIITYSQKTVVVGRNEIICNLEHLHTGMYIAELKTNNQRFAIKLLKTL